MVFGHIHWPGRSAKAFYPAEKAHGKAQLTMSNHKDLNGILIQVSQLAESVAASLGLSVIDVRLGQEGRRRSLKITIFKEHAPVALSDCEIVSRKLEELLDKEAETGKLLFDGQYVLEVESPGIARELKTEKEFCLFKGRAVRIQLTEKIDRLGASFTGILAGSENGSLRITHAQTANKIKTGKGKQAGKQKNKAGTDDAKWATTEQQDDEPEVLIELAKVAQIKLNPD